MDLIDVAQRASYQVSPSSATKLRKMTRAAGLNAENIVSRLAIVRSLREPFPTGEVFAFSSAGGKEIKGATLLGKRKSAALLVGLMCYHAEREVEPEFLRSLVRFHWERGLDLLSRECTGTSVTAWMARKAAQPAAEGRPTSRDEVARAIGRQFGRWPLEVRRLLANAGRLDVSRALELARQVDDQVRRTRPGGYLSEGVALEILRDGWGINRLGLGPDDRRLLTRLQAVGGAGIPRSRLSARERAGLPYLLRLELIADQDPLILGGLANQPGAPDLWSLR